MTAVAVVAASIMLGTSGLRRPVLGGVAVQRDALAAAKALEEFAVAMSVAKAASERKVITRPKRRVSKVSGFEPRRGWR